MNRHKRKRQALAVCLSLFMLLGMAQWPVVAKEWYIGDVTKDDQVDSRDVRRMMHKIVYETVFDAQETMLADLNGDGVCSTVDARITLERVTTLTQETLLPLAGFEDVADGNAECTYTMMAEYTDTYTFSCPSSRRIAVEADSGKVSAMRSVTKKLAAGEICTVTVTVPSAGARVALTVTPQDNVQRLPYEPEIRTDPTTLDTVGDASVDPLERASLEYTKREGGTYVYANNPERLAYADIGQAILRNKGLTGYVEFTYEHSNFTGQSIYLGYQLKNEGTEDLYVTVQNIGMQVQGEWLGQQSWSDYYNRRFELPEDYFDANGNENERYKGQDFIDYTPRVYQPVTYRIPAGQYIYVLGGTSADAYNTINVASTANKQILNGRCSNGVVKFRVTGGEVTGTFYCYTKASQVKAEPQEQGFILDRSGASYGLQYKGVDYHQGLLESEMVWYVNDNTPSQDLPVSYETAYDYNAVYKQDSYEAYNSRTYTKNYRYWITNINPQSGRNGIGSDMMSFECVTTDGQTVTIDTEHADGYGTAANLGNWMVDYHDNMTFVNQGDTTRYFTINKNANGALMAMVLDADGNVLSTKCTIRPISESPDERQWELYTVEVPPHSVKQVTVSFLLMGNSYGNVHHWVTLE